MPYPPDLSDEDVDAMARREGLTTRFGAGSYLEEQNRRAVDRQTRQSIALTDEIRRLTNHIRGLTAAAIALALVSVGISIIALAYAVMRATP